MTILPSGRMYALRRLRMGATRADENCGVYLVSSQWDDGTWLHYTFDSPLKALDVFSDWMREGAIAVTFVRKQ